jgi:hypothetical protein
MHFIFRASEFWPGLLLAALLALPAQAQMPGDWKLFVSSDGFSIRYPADWPIRLPSIKIPNLDIVSKEPPANRAYEKGQSDISVDRVPIAKSFAQAMTMYSVPGPEFHYRLQTDADIPVPPGSQCAHMHERVASYDTESFTELARHAPPGPQQTSTDYYCQIGGTIIEVDAAYAKGDKREPFYQQIALTMARSIRVLH